MELNLDEITLLQDAVVLKQKIDEVMEFFLQKGFEAKMFNNSLNRRRCRDGAYNLTFN